MVSYDVQSLFTNVPLSKTVDICMDRLYRSSLVPPSIPEKVLRHLIKLCVVNNTFVFNGKVYEQQDGVAMGTSLGPTLANIWMCYLEEEFFVNDSIDIDDMNMETIFNEFEHSSKVENQKIVPSPKLAPKNELDSNSFSFVEDVLKFIADQTCLICDVESDSMAKAINHVEKHHFNLKVEESIKKKWFKIMIV